MSKIIATSVARSCFTKQHQTCKTKSKTDFLVSDRSCPKTDGLRPHHWQLGLRGVASSLFSRLLTAWFNVIIFTYDKIMLMISISNKMQLRPLCNCNMWRRHCIPMSHARRLPGQTGLAVRIHISIITRGYVHSLDMQTGADSLTITVTRTHPIDNPNSNPNTGNTNPIVYIRWPIELELDIVSRTTTESSFKSFRSGVFLLSC